MLSSTTKRRGSKYLIPIKVEALIKTALSNRKKGNGKACTNIARARKKLQILDRDEFKCVDCGATDKLTIDHIKYKYHGGELRYGPSDYNLDLCQTLCVNCHRAKNMREVKELRLVE